MGYKEKKDGRETRIESRRETRRVSSQRNIHLPFPPLEIILTLITITAAIWVVANFGAITASIAIFIANALTSMIFPVVCVLGLISLVIYWNSRRWRRRW